MNQDDLIKKWLNNDLTTSESKDFEKLEDYELNKKIIEEAQGFKASHFSTVSSFDEFKSKHILKSEKKKSVFRLDQYKAVYRIAAMLVVALGIYFAFFNSNLTSVKTLSAERTTFELPDASTVTLNAASLITYNKKKWDKKRALNLDGEAYFKVAKGAKFDVTTEQGVVSVLGTQFTVKQRDDFFEVKCFEGIVRVAANTTEHILTQGNTFRILNGEQTLATVEKDSPEWIHNITNFESVPLSEVLNELERQYTIVISAEGIDVNRIFTGGFSHTDIDEALRSITIPLSLSYKKEGKNIIIYNSK
ncbi:MAG: DUF4974 domain-containing protein [Flavobacteriaceae bacterium]|nr:DUF4974 domain-containing protein [Flavobacteriaceae bacterium]